MTTNQLVLLLDIHRGFDRDIHPGTLKEDLDELALLQLIRHPTFGRRKASPGEYETTEQGDKLVRRLLEQAELR